MRPRSSDLAVALLFVVLSVLMTWPLARNLSRAASDWGDPFLNACYLDWDVYAATHSGVRLFDAPVFYPNHDTLAFSEHLCGLALFAAPMLWLGASPITAANLLWILGFAFTGFAAYLLGRIVTDSLGAGIAGGIFAAFVPWRFGQLPHLQIALAGWLPLMIVALLHFEKQRSWRNTALFGAAFFMNGWTNLHYFVFGSVAIALTVPIVLKRDARSYLKIGVVTALALVLLLPFLLPYREAQRLYHIRGNIAETRHYSAEPRDWLFVPEANRFYAPQQSSDGPNEPERRLFPGYLSLLLAAAGLLRREAGSFMGRAIGALWVALGFFGSLGLNGSLHPLLMNAFAIFNGIRVPARWAVIAYFGLALLVAVGVKNLAALWERRVEEGWRTYAILPTVSLALLFELRAAPIRWYLAPRDTPAVYRWLKSVPMHGGVAHLPFGEAQDEYLYMLHETTHHRPMLNGWGFNPPSTAAITALAQRNPIPDALMDELEKSRCSLLLVHAGRIPAAADFVKRQMARGRLLFVRRFDEGILGDYVFAVRRIEPDARPGDLSIVQRYLTGMRDGSEAPFGFQDVPPTIENGAFDLHGWSIARGGVARVTVWFEQHSIPIEAALAPRPVLVRAFPRFAARETMSFRLTLSRRPDGIRELTDYEIEIVGRDGQSALLPDTQLTWR